MKKVLEISKQKHNVSKRKHNVMRKMVVANDDVLATEKFRMKYLMTWDLYERKHFHFIFECHHFWGTQFMMPVFFLQGTGIHAPGCYIKGYTSMLLDHLERDLTTQQRNMLKKSYDSLVWLVKTEEDKQLKRFWANMMFFLKEKRSDAIAYLRQENSYDEWMLDEIAEHETRKK